MIKKLIVGMVIGTGMLGAQNLIVNQQLPANILTVPNRAGTMFEAGKTNYSIFFTVTNSTSIPKKIIAHQVSCGCSTLQSTRTDFAPGEVGKIKVVVNTGIPATKSVYLIDEATNWYTTQILITNLAPSKVAATK